MSLLKGIRTFKSKLTHLGNNEPLNFFSIALLIALDLFVLTNIFQGLDFQTEQLQSPYEVIPYQCLEFVEAEEGNLAKQSLIFDVLQGYNNYYSEVENKYSADFVNQKNKEKISLNCREIYDQAILVSESSTLEWQYDKIQELEQKKSNLKSEINSYQNNYDTMLLEQIADQSEKNSLTEGNAQDVKKLITNLQNEVNTLDLRITEQTSEIMENSEVVKLFSIIETNKDEIIAQNKSLKFWYPLKKTAIEFLFLLPLLFLFLYLYRYSLRKNKELLILIFSHLLIVAFVPVVFEVIRLLLEIIPFHVLEDVLEILEALNLVVIWNYLLIFIGIGCALVLIYLVQKKLFSRERTYLKRIAKKQCFACGTSLHCSPEYCYKCGEQQKRQCPNCKKFTYKTGIYCVNCGHSFQASEE